MVSSQALGILGRVIDDTTRPAMSTLLAHVAAGTALYFSVSRLRSGHTWWVWPGFVLLAIMPDFDYFAIWIFGVRQPVRITHTLIFCLAAGTLAWRLTRHLRQADRHSSPLTITGFLLAPVSHLVLDFSVGVHTLPLFWPLPGGDLMAPLGVLPSVIHTRNVFNVTMWRHFIIETVVLIPMLMLAVARARSVPVRRIARPGLMILPLWCSALAWSLSLPR